MQLFRDGMFNLCQGYLNKAIDRAIFIEIFFDLLKISAKLISQEIPRLTVEDYSRSELDEQSLTDLEELLRKFKDKKLKPKGSLKEPDLQDKPGVTEKDEDTGSEPS